MGPILGNEVNYTFSNSPVPGIGSGNSIIDQVISYLMGGRQLFPRPMPGTQQSTYDAMVLSRQNAAMHMIGRQAFADSRVFSGLGNLNPNNMLLSMAGASDPNGLANRIMAPLMGGNIVQAQMKHYSMGQGLGRDLMGLSSNLDAAGVKRDFDMFQNSFYNVRQANKDEMQARIGADTKNFNEELFKMSNRAGMAKSMLIDESLASVKDDKTREALRRRLENADFSKFGTKEGEAEFGALTKDIVGARINDKAYSGINFEKTRGFTMENIVGAIHSGANAGLVNIQGPGGLSRALNNENFMGSLDAARGMYGNDLSGSDLISRMDQFAGRDGNNGMSDGKMEKALRTVKAMSRKLGVDLQTMEEMLKTTSQFADSLGIQGGVSQMSLSGTLSAGMAGVSGVLRAGGGNISRMEGGQTGMIQNIMAGQVAAGADNNIGMLHAMYAAAKERGNDFAANKIAAYMQDSNSDMTGKGIRGFIKEAAEGMRMTPSEMARVANNKLLQGEGFKAMMEVNPLAAQGAYVRGIMQSAGEAALNNRSAMGAGGYNKVMSAAYGSMEDLDTLMSKTDPKSKQYAVLASIKKARTERDGDALDLTNIEKVLSGHGMMSNALASNFEKAKNAGGNYALMQKYNRAMHYFERDNRAAIDADMADSKEFEKKNARFNSPLLTNAMSLALDGKLSEEGVTGFVNKLFSADDMKGEGATEQRDKIKKMLTEFKDVGEKGFYNTGSVAARSLGAAQKLGIKGEALTETWYGKDGKEIAWDEAKAEEKLKKMGILKDDMTDEQKADVKNTFRTARAQARDFDPEGKLITGSDYEKNSAKAAMASKMLKARDEVYVKQQNRFKAAWAKDPNRGAAAKELEAKKFDAWQVMDVLKDDIAKGDKFIDEKFKGDESAIKEAKLQIRSAVNLNKQHEASKKEINDAVAKAGGSGNPIEAVLNKLFVLLDSIVKGQ